MSDEILETTSKSCMRSFISWAKSSATPPWKRRRWVPPLKNTFFSYKTCQTTLFIKDRLSKSFYDPQMHPNPNHPGSVISKNNICSDSHSNWNSKRSFSLPVDRWCFRAVAAEKCTRCEGPGQRGPLPFPHARRPHGVPVVEHSGQGAPRVAVHKLNIAHRDYPLQS